jgi:DNA primase
VWWCLEDGTRGIGDHAFEDLVYRTERDEFDQVAIVAEGERAADAIRAAGYWAVGILGASSRPGRAVIDLLASWPVVLWPDRDRPGVDLMSRIGEELEAAGVRAIAIVRPPADAPSGWDAADAPPAQVRELIEDAMGRWIGPVPR